MCSFFSAVTQMYSVLCFGDSNTWGMNPQTMARFEPELRWTGVLQKELGTNFKIIEEGLVGRTAAFSFPFEPEVSGLTYFLPCVKSHAPLDMIVLMLGTNDLAYGATPLQIARGLARYIPIANENAGSDLGKKPKILLISPVQITGDFEKSPFREIFGDLNACIEKSRHYSKYVQEIAGENGCMWLDSAAVAKASVTDGLHFDARGHAALGQKIAEIVKKEFY